MSEPNRTTEPAPDAYKPSSVRQNILYTAADIVTKDRNEEYGEPEDVFEEIAMAWNSVFKCNFEAHDVALALILLKVVRAKHNPAHMDNWTDMAGYAACGAEVSASVV